MRRLKEKSIIALFSIVGMLILCQCSSSRHVPAGSYLLDKVKIMTDSVSPRLSSSEVSELTTYLRQQPNHKVLYLTKLRLGVYNMSGSDSTKWWNRWIRKLGEPPVIYDSLLTKNGCEQLKRVYENRGYLKVKVESDTVRNDRKRKIEVDYVISPGERYFVRNMDYIFNNDSIRKIVMTDSSRFYTRPGIPLDRNLLEKQRETITSVMRNKGYYNFSKEYITFTADTTSGLTDADLIMNVNVPDNVKKDKSEIHPSARYLIRNVYVVTDFEPSMLADRSESKRDTVTYKGLQIFYGDKRYLKPSVLSDNCFLRPGMVFRQRLVDRTYQAFSRLSILKFISVKFEEVGVIDDSGLLDAYILLTPGKSQNISAELEGTNSEGDLGVAVGLNYSHYNVGKGSETLSTRLRAAYESLSGNLDGLLHNRYLELSADVGVTFPKFKAPFLRERFKRRINATTQLSASINYQERPEYTRIISTAGWSYKWSERRTGNRHTFTPIDINYVYLPESTNEFLNQIAPDNPLLRYSYEDHFIMRLGYSFYHTNKRTGTGVNLLSRPNIYTIRVNAEIAGNLLYALSNIFDHRSNVREHPYKVFGINYSQYFKVDCDFAFLHFFDRRNSLAFHTGLGVGYPYGNSSILPFEKRFYGGGANGVRGWAVRTLGPGCYPGRNSVSDFMNQCGDIRFDLSVEYRAKLFRVLELGAFIDAGNIWTIKNYSNQPGGLFSFKKFYKEIAAAYGLGLRLDFDYFLIRFDMGLKAHNPALGEEPWPLIHPHWRRDHSFHFSIGYPF